MIFALAAALVTAALLYTLLFEDGREFIESVKSCFTPELFLPSFLFPGSDEEDDWGQTKLIIWMLISMLVGALAYAKFG
ncbi:MULTISPECIES: hypothetical protein [Eikenella]|uniref:Uncharacterized protein n=1 Tax=Eikenella longinqua TaxID=1795827 RepID=A0A1A9RZL2_9NEIS|nr:MULTISPECIES: hypothetical protein [Eikenella]OAM29338.1 hypothetical protein A7P95_03765 [Eikenella longinqua]